MYTISTTLDLVCVHGSSLLWMGKIASYDTHPHRKRTMDNQLLSSAGGASRPLPAITKKWYGGQGQAATLWLCSPIFVNVENYNYLLKIISN